LDLIAVISIGTSFISGKRLYKMNRVDLIYLTLIGLWLLLTFIIRSLLIGISLFAPLTDIKFLNSYVELLRNNEFIFIWVISNTLLILFLVTDSYINTPKEMRQIFNDPRFVFGLFSLVPVLVLFFESFLHLSYFFFNEGVSSMVYIGLALVVSKSVVAPILGRRVGKLETKKIIESNLPLEIVESKMPIIINMKKTRYLRFTKKITNIFVVIGIISLILPFSPFFLMNMYKEPEISVTIYRLYTDNEALGILEYVEGLPLASIAGINSENIMTNSTLQDRLNLIEDSTIDDIFYIFSSSPSYLRLFWEMSVEKLNDTLLDTSIVENYWPQSRSGYYGYEEDFEDSYFFYWVDGTKHFNLGSFNSSELYAEWLCKGIQTWTTNRGSLFGSNTIFVDQLVFLDDNLNPVCFVYREYSGGYYYI
jgi:hypothetical protein